MNTIINIQTISENNTKNGDICVVNKRGGFPDVYKFFNMTWVNIYTDEFDDIISEYDEWVKIDDIWA